MTSFSSRALSLLVSLWLGHVAAATVSAQQKTFASPQEAADALFAATQKHDSAALHAIFGPDSQRLLFSGDQYADAAQETRFAEDYAQRHTLIPQGQDHVVIQVGEHDWPMPIPIVENDGRWHFDTHAGDEEIIDRRIGRNELSAIRTLLTSVDAQHEFFDRAKQQTGTGYYSSRFVSMPGRQDGLYWPAGAGQPDSPLEPLIEAAQEQGYPGETRQWPATALSGLLLPNSSFAGTGGARRSEEFCRPFAGRAYDRRVCDHRMAGELWLIRDHEF